MNFSNFSEKCTEARKAILEHLKHRYQTGDSAVIPLREENSHRWFKPQDNYFSGQGALSCPICKTGSLRYSRAAYNGHVHAACTTNGCVRWME